MKKNEEIIDAIFEIDGIFIYNKNTLEVAYDDEIHGASESAKEELKRRVIELQEKAVYTNNTSRKELFASRVTLLNSGNNSSYLTFKVDNIEVINPNIDRFSFSTLIHISQAAIYLNSIKSNGLDLFVENYKTALKSFAEKFESSLNEQLEKSRTSSYSFDFPEKRVQEDLRKLWNILFLTQIHLTLGIENERLIDAFEKIRNLVL